MKPHKWAKEIKAWADGAEIEQRWHGENEWEVDTIPVWNSCDRDFRIKPQPKEDLEKEHYRKMAEKALAIPEISEALDRLIDAFSKKEPQYLYVYRGYGKQQITGTKAECIPCVVGDKMIEIPYIGKIKLEE